ncbi:topoisomerase DNA-binding C4 zinc finger domain-containing protein [Glaciecola siphonariae]|uniref:Topoisomerase DNA-binding C4 zinc finger domain-containing protein n=1 Tax=Glaciecola siphonariae TaxID=521012 RepID=A0ABV9LRJ9_9ALTE
MAKINSDLFVSAHGANELAYGTCPQCEAQLAVKHVGKSTFLGCSAYPKCDYTKSLGQNDVSIVKEMPQSHCPQCDGNLAVKKGRYGMFIGCTNFPTCHFISNNHTAKKTAQYTPVECPACKKGTIDKKQNRFGKYFYACNNYPACKYVLNQMPLARKCEICNSPIMLVQSKDKHQLLCANADCGHTVKDTL